MGGLEAAWGVSVGARWRLLLILAVLLAPADDPVHRGGYMELSLQNSSGSGIQLVAGVVCSAPANLEPVASSRARCLHTVARPQTDLPRAMYRWIDAITPSAWS